MSFWGIEVKPGKPFTHSVVKACGRLRISQATLGIGSSTKKSMVQCNAGNKSPVLLCSLLPDRTESCHLDLEFEEVDDVVFSVIGPRSVHLTGFYLGSKHGRTNFDDDSDTYGEEIGEADTEQSDQHIDDDEYEDSFINDDDLEVVPPSPVVSDEGMSDHEITKNEKSHRRRLKKKCNLSKPKEHNSKHSRFAQLVESDDDDDQVLFSSLFSDGKVIQHCRYSDGRMDDSKHRRYAQLVESDDDDDNQLPFSSLLSDGKVIQHCRSIDGRMDDPKHLRSAKLVKIDDDDDQVPFSSLLSDGKVIQHCRSRDGRVDDTENRRPRGDNDHADKSSNKNKASVTPYSESCSGNDQPYNASLDCGDKMHNILAEGKKVTGKGRKAKTSKTVSANSNDVCVDPMLVDEVKDDRRMQDTPAESEQKQDQEIKKRADETQKSESGFTERPQTIGKSKKKETGKKSKSNMEVPANRSDVCQENREQVNEADRDKIVESAIISVADGPHNPSLASTEGHEIVAKPKKKKEKAKKSKAVAAAVSANLHDVSEDGVHVEAQSVKMEQDQSPDSLQKTESAINGKWDDPGAVVDESQSHEKTGRKKRKIKGDTATVSLLETKPANTDARISRSMTSSEDLVVEELEMGKPDGKVASSGKKVTIHYAAKLKEGTRVFESTIGGDPFKLRLGKGQLVQGLDIGLEGMQEGGRRRIKVPPHLGYGSEGLGETVPPNAWLIYDVELIRIR